MGFGQAAVDAEKWGKIHPKLQSCAFPGPNKRPSSSLIIFPVFLSTPLEAV